MDSLFFHYTSLPVLYSIISNNEIWLSNLKNSNDPNELYLSCDEYNSYIFQKLKKDPYHGCPRIAKTSPVVGNPYGISFTTLEDDLGQWERYGDHCRGVAIAFDVIAMNDYLHNTYGFKLDFDAIKYTEEEKIEYIKELIEQIPELNQSSDKMCWPYYAIFFTIHYALSRVLFKREGFALEKEYRLYIDLDEHQFQRQLIERLLENDPPALEDFRKTVSEQVKTHGLEKGNIRYALMRNGINSYLRLRLSLLGETKHSFIKKIVLGPLCTQDTKELEGFLSINGFSPVVQKSSIQIR